MRLKKMAEIGFEAGLDQVFLGQSDHLDLRYRQSLGRFCCGQSLQFALAAYFPPLAFSKMLGFIVTVPFPLFLSGFR
jgi:hypothetical protein